MKKSTATIKTWSGWKHGIEDTRIKLKKNLLVKQDKEDMNEQMYSYMHAILGPEIMSELDRLNENDE